MDEPTRIADQMKRAWRGEAWHGPGLQETIADVTVEEAAARFLPDAHTIWEIVLHLATWVDIVRRRVEGEDVGTVSDADDWPGVMGTRGEDWEKTRRRLGEVHDRLIEAIEGLDPERLDEVPAGANSSRYVMLQGTVQHDLYHAGQVSILKRAARRV